MRVTLSLTNNKKQQQSFNGSISKISKFPTALILSDLDGTWLCQNSEARAKLDKGVQDLISIYDEKGLNVLLGYISARPPARVLKEKLPEPNLSITYNGGTIHEGLPYEWKKPFKSWVSLNDKFNFDSKKVLDLAKKLGQKNEFSNLEIKSVGEVVNNPSADDCKYVATICIPLDSIKLAPTETKAILDEKTFKVPSEINKYVATIKANLDKQGTIYEINQPYLFSGKPIIMFDISTPVANKGSAVDFLLDELKIEHKNVIVAGDGGNDIVMMTNKEILEGDGRNLVIIGQNSELREKTSKNYKSPVLMRPGTEASSLGVLQGIKNYLSEIFERVKPEAEQALKNELKQDSAQKWAEYYDCSTIG